MISLIKEQRRKTPKLCEIIRFLIVGGTATIIDMLVMGIFIYLLNKDAYSNDLFNVFTANVKVNDWHIILGTAIGFIVGLIFNYIFSLLYVYDYESPKAQTKKGFILFCILSTIGLGIQTLGMFILYSLIGINEWVAKITLVLVVLVFNYITRKIFVFQGDEHTESKSSLLDLFKGITKKELLQNMLFVISSMCLCLFMYNNRTFGVELTFIRYLKYIYAIATGGLVSFYLFIINKKALNSIKFKFDIVTILSVIYTIAIYLTYFIYGNKMKFIILISLLSIYSIYCYSHVLVNFTLKFIKNFFNELTDIQKKIFKYVSLSLIVYVTLMFLLTKIFTFPGNMYDAFLSFDTGNLVHNNYQINQIYVENDFRHFLMSLFIMPFAIIPSLFPIPLIRGYSITIIQSFIVAYTLIKIIQFLNITDKKTSILLTIMYLTTSTILLNVITAEKFVFAIFYIIATIDFSIKKSPLKWIFYIGSIGILTTNIFLLPIVVFTENKKFKEWLPELIVAVIIFISILMLSGQFNLLLFFKQSWDSLKRFSSLGGRTTLYQNFIQYLVFNGSLFFIPPMTFSNTISQADPNLLFSILGIILLTISLLGFITNIKDKLVQISFYWQIFMFALLVGIGWGAALNEMFIYTSIFLWSTFILLIKFINFICKKREFQHFFYMGIIIFIVSMNLLPLLEIINFAIKYY